MVVARIGHDFFCGLVKSAGAGLVNYKSIAWYVAQPFHWKPVLEDVLLGISTCTHATVEGAPFCFWRSSPEELYTPPNV